MPAEIRRLLFRTSELVVAVRDYRRRMQRPLPPGTLEQVRIEDGGITGACVILEVASDHGGQTLRHEFAGAELAAALILYCRGCKVPLPAGGRKTLEKAGDRLALVVSLSPRGNEPALPDTL